MFRGGTSYYRFESWLPTDNSVQRVKSAPRSTLRVRRAGGLRRVVVAGAVPRRSNASRDSTGQPMAWSSAVLEEQITIRPSSHEPREKPARPAPAAYPVTLDARH